MYEDILLYQSADVDLLHTQIRDEGGILALIQLLSQGNQSSQGAAAYAAGTLGNLARNSQNQDAIREGGGIIALIKVIGDGDQKAQAEAASALMNLAMNNSGGCLKRDIWGFGAGWGVERHTHPTT